MIRFFLIIQIIGFFAASLIHFGLLMHGYEHEKARIAESIIALILLAGLIIIYFKPERLQKIAFIVQAIALFGTFIGIFTIVVGVGPQSLLDVIIHIFFVTILVWGLILTRRKAA